MAKGTVAKEQIAKKMAEVFGADWIGERHYCDQAGGVATDAGEPGA